MAKSKAVKKAVKKKAPAKKAAAKKSPAKKKAVKKKAAPKGLSRAVAAEVMKFMANPAQTGTLKFCFVPGKGFGPWPECQV